MASNNLHTMLPFSTLTDYALINLLASSKERIMDILLDMKITNILKQKLSPTQIETLEDCSCQYYDVMQYNQIPIAKTNGISCFHQNIRSF